MHDFLLHREMQRVAGQVAAATQRIATARTIPEVVQAAEVRVDPMFRSIRHLFPDLKRVDHAADRRLDDLIRAQLGVISAAATANDARRLRGRFLATDWQALRGKFARHYTFADRESQKLLHLKHRAESGPP